jgi:dephospho-CoA kinase
MHPSLIAEVEERAEELCTLHPRAVILVDAALIYEAGLADHFARILVAWCTPAQQIERLMAKTGLPYQDALRRMASQIPAEEKRRRADYIIDCSGSLEETRAQVQALYPQIERLVSG